MKKWIVLFVGIICVSISAIFVKKANVTGLVAAFYRIVFALTIIGPMFFIKRKKNITKKNLIICITGGLLFGFELAFWNISVMSSTATIPTLLVNLSSVWVCFGAFVFLKEKVTIMHLIGNFVALLGVVIIIGINKIVNLKLDSGVLYALIASVFLAGYTLVIKKARNNTDTISVIFYALIGSLISLSIMCLFGKVKLSGFSAESWVYLVCIGVVTQVGGYVSINYALGHMDSIKVSLATLLQPVLTAVFASLLLNEIIKSQKIYGGIIILFGLGISFIKPKKLVGL